MITNSVPGAAPRREGPAGTGRRTRRLAVFGSILALVLAAALSACGGTEKTDAAGVSLQSIKDKGVLVVGTEGTYAPFTFHDDGSGELTGYDVEIARAVGKKLGVEVKFEETQWDAIFAGLDAGRFDMIANQVSITPEREQSYEFSDPYTVSPGVIITRADDDAISSFDQLSGKTVAQSLNNNWYDLAKESGANIQAVEGWAQSVELLKQGRIDATINDRLTFLDWQKNTGDDSLTIAATTDDESHNAFTFRQGSDDLVEAVNQALAELSEDGTLQAISEKYFGADVTK